jgi:hydrogenase expression/formation protein HypC
MCLSIPGKILKIEGEEATIDYGSETRIASLALKKDVQVGDYVIVSAKFVIEKIPESEAKEIIALWDKTDEI